MDYLDLFLLLPFIIMVTGSPGPANLTIAGTAMGSGRVAAICLAAGIATASLVWSVSSALGLVALLLWQDWIIEVIRYGGAGYLGYLGYRCFRSALAGDGVEGRTPLFRGLTGWRAYWRGFLVHISNPKAVLFFSSFYTIIFALGAEAGDLFIVVLFLACQSCFVFFGYAFLFSSGVMVNLYRKAERGFNFVIGVFFIVAVIGLLLADL